MTGREMVGFHRARPSALGGARGLSRRTQVLRRSSAAGCWKRCKGKEDVSTSICRTRDGRLRANGRTFLLSSLRLAAGAPSRMVSELAFAADDHLRDVVRGACGVVEGNHAFDVIGRLAVRAARRRPDCPRRPERSAFQAIHPPEAWGKPRISLDRKRFRISRLRKPPPCSRSYL